MGLRLAAPRISALRRIASRRASEHRVFSVDESTWARGEETVGPYVTFSCPDWCNVVAITESDEIVLVWQFRPGTAALSLELPGGVIDPGESPIDAARRE